ncbi:MAG: DUF1893 domain-containing protein, partial [Acutalibacteraceae bacterium]
LKTPPRGTKNKGMKMNTDLQKAMEIIKSDDSLTCVFCKNAEVIKSRQRGVAPLIRLIEKGSLSPGFSAADKVVGKAAAFLYASLKVENVYACVISESAKKVLTDSGIHFEYEKSTEYIINRKGDGMCPVEASVITVSDKTQALAVIRQTLAKLSEMEAK